MAKELPYFKWEPTEWDNGNIQMCSFESKGVFADLASLYWSRLGDLPYALALQKICKGNASLFSELIKHDIFDVFEEKIVIKFLDEQLEERGAISIERRKAAEKRWSDANALQMESKSNAKRREEKREEKKKIEEKSVENPLRARPDIFFGEDVQAAWVEWEQFRKEIKKKLSPSTAKKQMEFLGGRAGPEAIAIINQSIKNGWTGLFELKTNHNGTHKRTSTGISDQAGGRDYSERL